MSRCPQCRHENPDDAKFCLECGRRLALMCGVCGTELPGGAKFCKECGQAVGTIRSATTGRVGARPESYTPKHLAEKILTSKAALEGERKQVTVLFADLKGSMELLADRDPEEARKLLDPVLQHMMEAVHRYEGTVNQVMGDGIMALFGAPLAHEDHAVRACYAALRMQESVRRYGEGVRRLEGVPIRIRVGLNSGEVVVRAIGSDLHMDYTAVGQTTHLAARMEQIAAPDSITLTPATLGLAEGFFEVKSLGPTPVKGLADPVEVFELTGATAMRSRLHAVAARGLTKFVGRSVEMAQLHDALDLVRKRKGQVVAVVGEPGIGKSRLYWEFTHTHRTDGCLVTEAASLSYGKATAYYPVIELLRDYFAIERRDDPRRVREKVIGKLFSLDRALESSLPALLSLLDVPVEDDAWSQLGPPQRRQRTLDSVKRLLQRESQAQPLVIVFEDLHWIDGETQAVLDTLIESLPTARMLLLVNYRPEYQHPWGSKTYYRQLRIDPLPAASIDELFEALLGRDGTLAPLKRLLVERTEGNPFFIEESVRTLVETGALAGARGDYRLTRAPQALQIPATAQAILAARIDRLDPEDKRLLQTAAVIGKDFSIGLLGAIAEVADEALHESLTRLQAAEFVYETRLFPETEHTFKHALTHEVVYGGVLHERRRSLHGRILDAIERLTPDAVEQLAHHAAKGEVWERAAFYLRQAGEKAWRRSATSEAVAYLEQTVMALGRLPETKDVLERTVDAQLSLADSYHPLALGEQRHGALRAAEVIALKLADERRVANVRGALAQYAWMTGQSLREAVELAEGVLATAHRLGDVPLEIRANHHLGGIHLSLGSYEAAQRVLRRNVDLLSGPLGHERLGMAGFPAALSRSWLAWALAERGEFVEATNVGRDALRIAREFDHSYSLLQASCGVGWALVLQGEFPRAIDLAEGALSLALDRGFPLWAPVFAMLLGASYVSVGRVSEALHVLGASPPPAGTRLLRARVLGTRAAARLGMGDVNDAAVLAAEALALARERGEGCDEAYMIRLLAEIGMAASIPDAEIVSGYYHDALARATDLGMRPLVAHCHLGLGKLYRGTGKREEAQEHLTTATMMYRDMDMRFWLEQAEDSGAHMTSD